jgi:hypothetical protein
MRVKELVARLKKLDPRVVFVPGPGKVSGLYLHIPRHPEAHANGLFWIGAVPSPHWFHSMPEKDIFTEKKNVRIGTPPEYHRGWKTVLKLLVEREHAFTKAKIAREFGWEIFVPGRQGTLTALPGWNDPSPQEQRQKRLNDFMKAEGIAA